MCNQSGFLSEVQSDSTAERRTSTELAEFLVNDFQLTPQEAIDMLYTSETFERLQDNATGLYYQSAGYVYSFLQNEIRNARVA